MAADAWVFLGALARDTRRIRLGSLVSPVTFRHPSVLAKMAASLDHLSGGRAELGIGAGWLEAEHAAYGFEFADIATRMDVLEEQIEIVHRQWTEESFDFSGEHYRLVDSQARPQPVSAPHPNLIVGGSGGKRSARIAARWADEFNLSSSSPELAREKFAALDEACRAAGRDTASLTKSAMVGVLVGADKGELRKREQQLLDALGGDVEEEHVVPRLGEHLRHGDADVARPDDRDPAAHRSPSIERRASATRSEAWPSP
jgi:F420-dependent oxidoreductase-like protein